MRIAAISLTCVLVCAATVVQAETPTFTTSLATAPAGARGAVSGDFNGDGWVDIATADTGRNTVAIFLNARSSGGFLPAREVAVSAGPFSIAAGDLNRDGITDLVVTTPDSAGGTMDLLLMGPDGRPRSHTVATIGQSRGMTLADVNRDGILDIVYSSYLGDALIVLRGDGSGGFSGAGQWPVGSLPQGVAAADFNHDGFVDVAVASTNANALDVLYGSASGAFTRRSFSAGRTLNVLAIADVDADGWADIAAVSTATNSVAMFRGSASGFALAGTRTTGVSPRGIASGDFNRDGRPDFAVGNRSSNSVTVLLAHPGTVLPDAWGDLAAGAGARAVVAGDFDNDGGIDIAVACELEGRLAVFDNSTAFVRTGFAFAADNLRGHANDTRTVSADFNENGKPDLLGSGFVMFDDRRDQFIERNSVSFVYDVAAADYDRDGHVDALLSVFAYNPQFEGVELYRGDGHGGFTFTQAFSGMPGVHDFRLGDVDRDGRLDIVGVGVGANGDTTRGRLYVNLQGGAGTSEQPLESYAVHLELVDVNHDGLLDALVSFGDRPTIDVMLGDGAGHFAAAHPIDLGHAVPTFVVQDLNHDGRPDIAAESPGLLVVVLATADGWALPVEYSTAPPFDQPWGVIAADFDNDGQIDLLTYTGSLFPGIGDGTFGPVQAFDFVVGAGAPVDWNRDGLIDAATMFNVIVNQRRGENRPPIAEAGQDFTMSYKDQYAQSDGSLFGGASSDPDMHRLTYQWSDNETGATFSREASTAFPPKLPGRHAFTLTVFDQRGGRASDEVLVTITPTEEIVLYAAQASSIVGAWHGVADPTAAAGARVFYPNSNAPKVTTPLAHPASFVDVDFIADPTQTYKLWVRMKAQYNAAGNDSIWIQFSGSVDPAGRAAYRINSTSGLAINLEECSGCGISEWGWEDDGWGAVNRNGTLLRFPAGGAQQLRIQIREDGVSVDQIVLSAVTYRTARPGTAKSDTVIVPVPHPED
jgi:hypothetical protein